VALKRGDFLVVSGESRLLAAQTYLSLHVRNAAGQELPTTLDIRRKDPTYTFTAPDDGDYLIQLHDITGNMGNVDEGSYYRLAVTTGPWIDYATPPSVPRGISTRVTLHGWNLAGQKGLGVAAVDVNPPGDAQRVLVTSGGAPNSVWLPIAPQPLTAEKEPNPPNTPQPITLPALIDGSFGERGDVDAFQFTAKAKELISVDVAAREWDSWSDPVLQIRDSAGKTLVNVDDPDRGRDPRVVWTAPADGAYTLVLRDLAGGSRGGPESFYQVRIGAAEPELRLTAAEPTVTIKPGAKADFSLTLFQSYQPGEVAVSVEGLPKGVTAEPVKVAAFAKREGNSTVKLTFVAAADAVPGGTPIRIVAKAAGDHPLQAAALWQRTGDGGTSLGTGFTDQLLALVPAP
jgi:hypothetical protein